MTTQIQSAFRLPPHLSAKADPVLIGADERHFAAIGVELRRQTDDLAARLDARRLARGGHGEAALERDLEIHRLTGRLRLLRRFGLDLCLGRMVTTDAADPVYIGRLGLTDAAGRRLLVDWRAPAAEPFFAATLAHPLGLKSRRRYRWTSGRITDYWDEIFDPDAAAGSAAADDQSAFIASLGTSRSPRMRDVLATIQSDQDAVIRAGSRGALVVDGGPGTGKTVVALHRAAYLLYSEPRLTQGGGGVLFIGPSPAYLAYVDDVLPSLGEDTVQLCTLRDLVPEGVAATPESDPEVAALKSSTRLLEAVEAAVRYHEQPPRDELVVETPWADVRVGPAEWAEAFQAAEGGIPHDDARDLVWEELLGILADAVDDEEAPPALVRAVLAHDENLRRAFTRAWPLLDPAGVAADLWSVPSYLRRCAPWLDDDEMRRLQRDDPRAWTVADLPLLDAARQRIGEPEAARQRRLREAALAAEREERDKAIDHIIAADDSEMSVMSMLRGQDAQNSLMDEASLPAIDVDRLAGPFAHVVVDEAQELTDAEWDMILRRCPSRSLTIVGDRAQARHGFAPSWQERLARIGLSHVEVATLTINYRTPREVMAEAEPVIRAAIPEANVPVSVRENGIPVTRGAVSELGAILDEWLATHAEGIAAVIGTSVDTRALPATSRVRALTPEQAKGLEFDLVVLVDPDAFGTGIEGAVDRYVAMTRATERLVVLSGEG
ncbi:RNA polymerase recycling motor ATPase HelR [Microbacterium sp.]|uniref:RNA polymerase recycling motor ATPase HelR n=1 Tax=Microbacterium sp. TaxID=51671 RepID=UPI0039E54C66